MKKSTRRAFINQLVFGPGEKQSTDPGLLVCIFLRGGADTLNMIVPYGDDDYYKARPTIAIKKPQAGVADCAIKLDDFYAIHPKLAPLESVFKEGRLGIAQSVGTDNDSGSHFEAQDQMEHGVACNQQSNGGWLGRHLQTRSRAAQSPLCAVSISPTLPESLRGAPSASAILSVDSIKLKTPTGNPEHVAEALQALYQSDVGLLRQPGKDTLDLLSKVENLHRQKSPAPQKVAYSSSDFGNGLQEIARLINAGVGLEIACIDLGGWDTHFFQGSNTGLQAELIGELASGLAAFDADVMRHNSKITTLVITEFGRRTYENGSLGTDHGRGFALMAIGNTINGGKIHGDWPGMPKQEKNLIGPAGLPIRYDYRSVLSELLVSTTGTQHIASVFPNFRPQSVGLAKVSSTTL